MIYLKATVEHENHVIDVSFSVLFFFGPSVLDVDNLMSSLLCSYSITSCSTFSNLLDRVRVRVL